MYIGLIFKFEGLDLESLFLIDKVPKYESFASLALVDLSDEFRIVSHFNSLIERS